jgi:hypothetical protein
VNRILVLLACVAFVVALVLLLIGGGHQRQALEATTLGLALLAGGHVTS